MAKTQRYTDDQLISAILEYAQTTTQKIVITDLVKWVADNVPGLEGVDEHSFRAKITTVDKKTGKKSRVYRAPYFKIKQINDMRNITRAIKKDALLYSSDPEAFFAEPRSEQRKQILETRAKVDQLAKDCTNLESENGVLRVENAALRQTLRQQVDEHHERLLRIQQKQETIENTVMILCNDTSNKVIDEALERTGIMGNGIDLNNWIKSLHDDIETALTVDKAVKRILYNGAPTDAAQKNEGDVLSKDSMMEGLEF